MKQNHDEGMVDVGVTYEQPKAMEAPAKSSKKTPEKSYPTLYLPSSTKEMPDFPDGEFYFMCKGTVKRCVETYEGGKETTSCDIEVHGIKVMDAPMKKAKMKEADEDLDEELTKIESKKSK